ncbi:hypothetical protein ACQ4LE_005428 [Meloidogyne hapla]
MQKNKRNLLPNSLKFLRKIEMDIAFAAESCKLGSCPCSATGCPNGSKWKPIRWMPLQLCAIRSMFIYFRSMLQFNRINKLIRTLIIQYF